MFRRIFAAIVLILALGITVVLLLGPAYVEKGRNPVNTPVGGWPVSDRAKALHETLVIGDLHSDALLWGRNLLKRVDRGHVDIPRLQEGNVAVQVFTTVTKSPRGQNYTENSADAPDNITPLVIGQLRPIATWTSLLARALDQAARLNAYAADAPDDLTIIRSKSDLTRLLDARAKGTRTVGGILGTEGAHPLEGKLENVDVMFDAGFRIIGLTHFFDNELGGSLHGDGDGQGLTPFGRNVVAHMVDRRMIVDLAHASPQMMRDVLAMPDVVPILSHTGIHRKCASHRNLDDALLQGIARKGGIIGIGYWSDVICGNRPSDIADTIRAAIALLGENAVALGSDFDGSVGVPFDAAHLDALTQALIDKGLTDQQIAKVMGGNMMRYLGENLPD